MLEVPLPGSGFEGGQGFLNIKRVRNNKVFFRIFSKVV